MSDEPTIVKRAGRRNLHEVRSHGVKLVAQLDRLAVSVAGLMVRDVYKREQAHHRICEASFWIKDAILDLEREEDVDDGEMKVSGGDIKIASGL